MVSLLAILLFYLIGKENFTTLLWLVIFICIEILLLISIIRKSKERNYLLLNLLIFISHFFYGLIIVFVNLSMNVGQNYNFF